MPTVARPVSEAAESIRTALKAGDEVWAWREVIQASDDLARESHALRVALTVTRPPTVGVARYDALLAGVVDYWLTIDHLPRPVWLDDPPFTLSEPWDVEELPVLRARARETTPESIARHGVYLAEKELASV
jgi:hypothetical protein